MIAHFQLSDQDKAEIAALVLRDLKRQAIQLPPEYVPTKRLSRKAAAKHLGVSVATLDNRVKAGTAIRHYTPTNKPYFLLGELDKVPMPPVEPRRGVRKYERKRGEEV
jgi:hypothetical protein